VDTLLDKAEQSIFEISEKRTKASFFKLPDIIRENVSNLEQLSMKPGMVTGVSCGFTDLDNLTAGFQPSDLIILAARPSMGKTALVCNIAEAIARVDHKGVMLFSLEQSNLELAERFLCITARVNGHDLRTGNLSNEQRDLLTTASDELHNLPLFIDDKPARTMSQISAISRRQHRKEPLGAIIIDYLQLIEPEDKRVPREQQIASISRRLKFLAKELNVPVIALSQLNRGVELREDKRPRLADLRESGSIEQDADKVMFLHRPDAYDPNDRPGEAEIVIAKHRNGPTGIVKLTWRGEFMRFEDYSAVPDTDFSTI
jgi:replicative DNA helicase